MATTALGRLAELKKAADELNYKQAENRYKNMTLKRKQNEEMQMKIGLYRKSMADFEMTKQNALMKRVLSDPRLMREIAPSQNQIAKFNPMTGEPIQPGGPQFRGSTMDQFLPGFPIPAGEPSRQPGSIIPGRRNQAGQMTSQGFIAEGSPRVAPDIQEEKFLSGEASGKFAASRQGLRDIDTIRGIISNAKNRSATILGTGLSNIPFGIGKLIQPQEARKLELAMRNMIESRLRAETGASAPENEIDRIYKRFAPRPNDTLQTIEDRLTSQQNYFTDLVGSMKQNSIPKMTNRPLTELDEQNNGRNNQLPINPISETVNTLRKNFGLL